MPNMWDRLRPSALKDGGGAAPLNQKKLEQWQNARSTSNPQTKGYSYHISAGSPPPRPPREPKFEHYQTSATAAPPPPQSTSQRRLLSHPDSVSGPVAHRPVSSVYSQVSPAATNFAAQQLRADVYPDSHEISPPSSPDQRHDEGYVSPLEDMENPAAASAVRSNIPQMRRERRKNSDAALHAMREAKSRDRLKLRTEGDGRDPALGDAQDPGQPRSHQGQEPTNIFGIRLRQVRPGNPGATKANDPAATATPSSRPEWQGASRTGRTALVAPVRETPSAAPLAVPPRSSKRPGRGPGVVLPPVSSPESETSFPPPALPAPTNSSGAGDRNTKKGVSSTRPRDVLSPGHPVAASALPAGPHVASPQGYPSPPLSDDNHGPPKSSRQPLSSSTPHSPSPQAPSSTLAPPTEKAIRRKPASGADRHSHLSMSSSVYSAQTDIHPAERAPGGHADDWSQPPSRFSVSTDNDTPRPSIDSRAPPVPTPPRQFSGSSQQMVPPTAKSVLERKRPAVPGYEDASHRAPSDEPIKITMDSPYYVTSSTSAAQSRSQGSHPVPRGNYSTLSVASVATTDKSLPLAPPEESARDRVSQLNAQLKSLGNRRININQAIRQMTELMPTDNVLASNAVIAKREAEKRKVETLRNELADVQREEYDLGLKLHRAYKRMDRNAEYEPTTLWVRRVTG